MIDFQTMAPYSRIVLAVFVCMLVSGVVQAEERHEYFSIAKTMDSALAQSAIGEDIRLIFDQRQPFTPVRSFGTFSANSEIGYADKTADSSCTQAFISALVSLQQRARLEGANAVLYPSTEPSSESTSASLSFRCDIGVLNTSVSLHGEVVILEQALTPAAL
ncbi:MAG: hypothetical protein QF515_02720 [Pseudomonadales bacterium]|jgi:hypothetical protein|nr:hypothetical protein [Pseudomonadales bacterium]MDP6826023.1 hypothetical protein [Pseudomonadales bacterium]|tara:strand:- start:1850 stop:2335 length:486 start_codon:yes stop_codon:yes gene_type:complete